MFQCTAAVELDIVRYSIKTYFHLVQTFSLHSTGQRNKPAARSVFTTAVLVTPVSFIPYTAVYHAATTAVTDYT